jgi:DNA-binding winged helix-turn-helix (wHTH) protein/tetratricopeptide (TPR) repeat protein
MIYTFEGYEFDTARLETRRDGEVLHVEPQVFDVLVYLIEHRDHMVTKEELLDNIWGDRFVSESALTSRIKSARRLIGDDGSRQRLIRTVYGRGYRFVATVNGATVPGGQQPLVHDLPAPSRPVPVTVGRDSELVHLRTLVAAARQGERRVVFVAGAAGIGKTTLVERLLADLSFEDSSVGVGQCVEHRGAGEAYLPVFEAVHEICAAPGGAVVLEHLVERAPTWVLQLPGLVPHSRLADLQRAIVGGSSDRMLREMLDALYAAASEAFVVLVLEDLHWSDGSTLDLLEAIAMDRRPCRLLVIATHRPGGRARGSPTAHSLAVGLRLRNRAELITLDAVTQTDIEDLLAARFDAPAPAGLSSLLHSRTGGIPLFVERLLDAWLADGLIATGPDGAQLTVELEALAARIPDSVRQLIEHAFERLSLDEQGILSAASVAGREFAAAEVAAAAKRPEEDVESELADLGRRGRFVQPRGERTWPDHTVTAMFAFDHDLHREVLYERIGPNRTVTLHRALADRLEEAFGDDPSSAATLAAHYVAGGDAAHAVRYCILAAEHQLRRSAHREAIEHLRCATDMVARLPATRTRAEDELRLQITLGKALITAKGYAAPETVAVYARARQLCDQLGDGPHFLPVLYGLWNNVFVSGQHLSAYELASSFLQLAGRLDDDAIMVARRAVGWTLVFMGRAGEAQQHLDLIPSTIDPPHTALLLANYNEDPAAAGLAALSWARWLTGDDTAAQQASRQSLQRAASINHPFTQAYAHVMAAFLAQLRGDPVPAEHHATLGIEICQQHAIPFFEAVAMTPLGWARARIGDPHGIDVVRDGLAAAAATGAGVHRSFALATLGELLIADGDIDAALTTLDDAMATADASGEAFYTPEIERLRSDALCQTGNLTEALASAELALELADALAASQFADRATKALATMRNKRRSPAVSSRAASAPP